MEDMVAPGSDLKHLRRLIDGLKFRTTVGSNRRIRGTDSLQRAFTDALTNGDTFLTVLVAVCLRPLLR